MKKNKVNKRNLKYGGVSVVFTAVIVAAAIFFNIVIASLGQTFSWYFDLTGASVYTLSDAFGKNLDEILDAKKFIGRAPSQVTEFIATDRSPDTETAPQSFIMSSSLVISVMAAAIYFNVMYTVSPFLAFVPPAGFCFATCPVPSKTHLYPQFSMVYIASFRPIPITWGISSIP